MYHSTFENKASNDNFCVAMNFVDAETPLPFCGEEKIQWYGFQQIS